LKEGKENIIKALKIKYFLKEFDSEVGNEFERLEWKRKWGGTQRRAAPCRGKP
jgi:hypothetical protein